MLIFRCDYCGETYDDKVKSTLKGLSYSFEDKVYNLETEDSECHICQKAVDEAKKQALENRRVKKI